MKVMEFLFKIYVMQDIPALFMQEALAQLIDKVFFENERWQKFHQATYYKEYCFDLPKLKEGEKTYFKDEIVKIRIRTVNEELATLFGEKLIHQYTDKLKGLTGEWRMIQSRRNIERLYSLTPVVMKNDGGYWRNVLTLEEFETRLKVNLLKKYKQITGETLDDNFDFYTSIKFLNGKPIGIPFKNILLLGDKIELQLTEHPSAQKLAKVALGAALLENNSRGNGFVGYAWSDF